MIQSSVNRSPIDRMTEGGFGMTDQPNIFGYMRISTQEERQKQRYNRQENALNKYAQAHGFEYVLVFKEDVSGKNFTDRKQWTSLERLLRAGDTIVIKDISRFTREAEAGYKKYMSLLNKGINLIFIDNPTVSTDYIRQLLHVAETQDIVAKTSLEGTVKLLLIVELDRAERERTTLIQRTKDGIAASSKRSGRERGHLDKMTPEVEAAIRAYLSDRSITQQSIMKKYGLSRNTVKKYAAIIREESRLKVDIR